jgi:hypothetical protein
MPTLFGLGSIAGWIFPRDPDFAAKAGRILDLYERLWEEFLSSLPTLSFPPTKKPACKLAVASNPL